MAARGNASKEIITNKILEIFEGSFLYGNKELRIPMKEDGNQVEIKLTMTCAKTNVADTVSESVAGAAAQGTSIENNEPTQEEINQVAALMNRLGL